MNIFQLKRQQYEDNLKTLIDDFVSVVNSGNMEESTIRLNQKIKGENSKRHLSSPNGRYPIQTGVSAKASFIQNALATAPISNSDRQVLEQWLNTGGLMEELGEWTGEWEYITDQFKDDYDEYDCKGMDNDRWWRLNKGILWRFYNFCVVTLEDPQVPTIDAHLIHTILDLIDKCGCFNWQRHLQIVENLYYSTGYEYEFCRFVPGLEIRYWLNKSTLTNNSGYQKS